MKILHVLDHSIPLHSGYTFRTLSLLREQRKLGWDTFHITSPKHGAGMGAKVSQALEETVDGWHFYRTPTGEPGLNAPGLGELRVMRQLERRLQSLAEQLRPDIIHAHSPVLNVLPALKVGRRLGIPVVYEVRAFWEDAAVDHGTTSEGSFRYRATRSMETYALKKAQHVFTICEGLRNDIVGRGIAANKVTVIPNAVDITSFEPGGQAEEALKVHLGLDGCTVLGFIGSFYAYEGLDLLLESLPGILRRRPDVRVLLVGGGPQESALKAQAAKLGLIDKVVFTGRVPHAEVKRYYDLVDVLVYPRHSMRLTELVTPLKPLEAMAQGRILIASDVGGHQELIREGQTGQLFSAGSVDDLTRVTLKLLDDPSTFPSLRRQGRAFVEAERNWTKSTSGYVEAYERLVAEKKFAAGAQSVVMAGPLPPAIGGMASVLGALANSVLSQRVNLQLFETGKTTEPNRPLWKGIYSRMTLMWRWWRKFASHHKPIAHIHTCSGLTFFLDGSLLLLCRLRQAPVVLHIHGARFDAFLDSLNPVFRGLARWIGGLAEAVVVLSPEWRERLSARWPSARLVVVANGVQAESSAAAVDDECELPCFVFLGNLGIRKGVPQILDAASMAKRPWRLQLAGGEEDPGYLSSLRHEVLKRGLEDRLEVLGPVVGASKNALLTNAQGFVLPSLAEGLPMALLEAMAIGLPSVVTAAGAMPEVVRNEQDGLVVPVADSASLAAALDRLAEDAALRGRLGRSAALRCRDLYGIDRMATSILEIYKSLRNDRR